MKTWTRIKGHSGLRRHKSGTIYLHARKGGSRSLETTEVLVACRKRDQILAQARENPVRAGADLSVRRFIGLQRALIEGSGAKPRTIQYNLSSLATLEKGWPRPERSIRDFSTIDVELMMAAHRKRYSPTRFNGLLWQLRALFALAIKHGARLDDPSRELKMGRVPIHKPNLWLPSDEQFVALVGTVRQQSGGQVRADYILFLRWTGLRVNEAANLCRNHIDLDHWQINLPGTITKNSRPRSVPIFPPIREIVRRWLTFGPAPGRPADRFCPVWNLKGSLKSACTKLGFPVRLTHHDFRHLFTYLMEQGVPPHNIAKWVGHLDHGRLIMATYTSIRDQVETDLIDRLEKNLTRSELPKNVVPLNQAL